jgi:SAM-dependent methyltransferase
METERTLTEAWEAEAGDWTAWARAPGHDSYWRFHRDAFLELVPPPGVLTLDVGCGEGRLARDLAALGHRVVALDLAPSLVRLAAEAGGGLLGVVRADAARLPVPDGAVDLVVAFMSLQDMDDMDGTMREIGRVLRAGGRLCLAVVHPVCSGGSFRNGSAGEEYGLTGDYFERRRYRDVVERGGLRMTFESWHRPLRDYFAALEGIGMLTEAVREPQPLNGGRWDRVPLFVELRAVRP